MTEPESRLKGDRIVESLERGEHWFTQHRVKIAIFATAFIVAAFVSQALENQSEETQAALWNEATKLTSTQEKLEFIKNNQEAESAKFLMLQTSRQLLEEKKFKEAEALSTEFILGHQDHPRLSSMLMMRAYAREEQGEVEGATADYQRVQGMNEKVNQYLSTQALARLR